MCGVLACSCRAASQLSDTVECIIRASARSWRHGFLMCLMVLQQLHGSSSSLGASPKSSSGYLHSASLSSDVEDVHSPSSTNGSLTHLEVSQ